MKTPAISNQVNIVSGTASATRQPGASADMPFSQMLSREMASQAKPAEPTRSSPVDSKQNAQPAQNEAKASEAQATEESGANAAQQGNSNALGTDKSGAAAGAKSGAAADDKGQDEDTTVSAASAELLALVAGLTQAAAPVKKDIDSSDAGTQAGGQFQDPSVMAQAQAADQLQASPAGLQALAQLPAAPISGQGSGLLRDQTSAAKSMDAALTAPGSPAAHKTGAGQKFVAGTETAQQLGGDIKPGTEIKGDTSASEGFDAELAQAKGETAAPENTPSKTPGARSDLAGMASGPDKPSAKPAHELQLAGAAPLNSGAPSPAQLQPAQLQAAQAAPTHMSDMLTPRVGGPNWDQALGQKVVWMVGGGLQSASLTLNPPDLGPLQVVLHVSDSQASANFTAAQPEVRHALEAAMPKLREMLGDAGIQLGQANVSAGNPNQNQQQNPFTPPQQQSSRPSAGLNDGADTGIDTPVRVTRTQISSGQGMVDTFA